MKVNINYIPIMVLLLGSLVYSCKQSSEPVKMAAKNAPLVKVQPAIKTQMVSFIEITGTIQANVFTDIKSPADGIIETLMARENQQVEKDRIIAVINPNDRVALISNNQLQVQKLEAQAKKTDKNSDDYQKLLLELEKAKENLDYATKMYQTIPVICPMNGLVTQRWLDKGNQIGIKEKILTITDMNSLVIKSEVNEKYFEVVKQGKKLPVLLSAYPNDTLQGQISLVYPQIDPTTRSVRFDIKLLNFNKKLLPGMMASIKVPVASKDNAIVVPEHAVLTSPDNKNFLFVVKADSVASRRSVKTGISSGTKLEIVNGLKENEKVVISGQEMLKDSVKVRIMSTTKAVKK
ncbi:MAG: efflux RND transporter periplasmic adaptor subunit [Bacteroidales bacterium]|nr:efflux RND transporter periplasmic adaptor subunit [Bacteroidales bacterium]